MARRNIVERYIRADIEKRVEIILDNYGMFNRILDGYEQSLREPGICREQELRRSVW